MVRIGQDNGCVWLAWLGCYPIIGQLGTNVDLDGIESVFDTSKGVITLRGHSGQRLKG